MIPEDIMKTARKIGDAWFGSGHHDSAAIADEVARAILAERERCAPKWLPIETAPKDGTSIIGSFWSVKWADSHRRGDVVRCWFQPEFEAFISSCREMVMAEGYTINGKTRELHSPVVEPVTHWMPLPAGPAS